MPSVGSKSLDFKKRVRANVAFVLTAEQAAERHVKLYL